MNINRFKKEKYFVIICTVVLFAFTFSLFRRVEDPLGHGTNEEIMCERVLTEIEVSNHRFLTIYLNKKGNLACTMYEKDFFKKYLFVSSELAIECGSESPNVIYTAYMMDGKPYWMVWGVVDDDVVEVIVGKEKGNIVIVEDIKIFYFIDQPGNIPSTDSFEFGRQGD